MDKFLGQQQTQRDIDEYTEIEADESESLEPEVKMDVRIAEVHEQQDALDIKDAVYDGNLVVADITRLRTSDPTVEHITEELRQVADEVGGDIVKNGDDQIIVTPTGVRINREKLGSR